MIIDHTELHLSPSTWKPYSPEESNSVVNLQQNPLKAPNSADGLKLKIRHLTQDKRKSTVKYTAEQ